MEKEKNVIEIKVCVDGMDELKKFIKKMEKDSKRNRKENIVISFAGKCNVLFFAQETRFCSLCEKM